MKKPFVTLTSDFGVQSQGVGIMEGVISSIAPDAHVIHLMHGLPDFDIICGARTMETLTFMPVGFHICVVDPGVGTKRRAIIVKVGRGDYLVGPDNGVLLPAVRVLGGSERVVEITNEKYMVLPISPIFHGRSIFAPAAAHLAAGVPMAEFGADLDFDSLTQAPYEEAIFSGSTIEAKVVHINKYGSLHLNITHAAWDQFGLVLGQKVTLHFEDTTLSVPFVRTFGDAPFGEPVILKDDYGRVEVAINMGSFSEVHHIKVGSAVKLMK